MRVTGVEVVCVAVDVAVGETVVGVTWEKSVVGVCVRVWVCGGVCVSVGVRAELGSVVSVCALGVVGVWEQAVCVSVRVFSSDMVR